MALSMQNTMENPNRSGHLGGIDSGNVNPLYMDQHFGALERGLRDNSFMRAFLNVRTVRGTDTLTNPRMGRTQLQKLQRGVRAEDHSPTYDNISIKVDTVIIARTCEFVLEEFQSSYQTRTEIGMEQGEEHAQFFDEATIAQYVKGAQITTVDPDGNKDGGWEGLAPTNIERTAPEGHRGGTIVVLAGANDHRDPDLLEAAMRKVTTGLKKKSVKPRECAWLISHDTHEVLSYNEQLINRDLNPMTINGQYHMAEVERVAGSILYPNNYMPEEVHVRGVNDHFLSNAANNWAYNNTANDVKCVAVLVHPKGMLAGESIPMTTDIYFDKKDKQWYIDAWQSFAVTPNRAEFIGAVFENGVA